MRIPDFYNWPFAVAAKGYQSVSSMLHAQLGIGITYVIATRFEAPHYADRIKRFEGQPGARWAGRAAPFGGRQVGSRFWGKHIPSSKSILCGAAYTMLLLEIRSGGGALSLNSELLKFSIAQSFWMVTDAVVLTRYLMKPDLSGNSVHPKLQPFGRECSKQDKVIATAYFGLRVCDKVLGGLAKVIHSDPNRLPMFPLLNSIGRFGIVATWKITSRIFKLPIDLIRPRL